MQDRLVLDTSAILSGRLAANVAAYAPESILTEFQPGGRSRRALDYLLEAGLRLVDPTPASLRRVEEAAERTGDDQRLSAVDVDVLAVALDVGGRILTDDYSIQNVASALLVPFQGVEKKGIEEQWAWVYRCRGCGRIYRDLVKECTVCGTEVRAVKARPGQR